LRGSEDFVRERKNFIVYALLNFKPLKRFESRVDMGRLWGPDDSTCERILDMLKTV